jgi:transposase
VILDNGSYNSCQKTREEAGKRGIKLHFLPPYSPNLNHIERLWKIWKIMNEHARNNRFFGSAKEFRESIFGFFAETWPLIRPYMSTRINDSFHIVKKSSFSS